MLMREIKKQFLLRSFVNWFEQIDYKNSGFYSLEEAIKSIYDDDTLELYEDAKEFVEQEECGRFPRRWYKTEKNSGDPSDNFIRNFIPPVGFPDTDNE